MARPRCIGQEANIKMCLKLHSRAPPFSGGWRSIHDSMLGKARSATACTKKTSENVRRTFWRHEFLEKSGNILQLPALVQLTIHASGCLMFQLLLPCLANFPKFGRQALLPTKNSWANAMFCRPLSCQRDALCNALCFQRCECTVVRCLLGNKRHFWEQLNRWIETALDLFSLLWNTRTMCPFRSISLFVFNVWRSLRRCCQWHFLFRPKLPHDKWVKRSGLNPRWIEKSAVFIVTFASSWNRYLFEKVQPNLCLQKCHIWR